MTVDFVNPEWRRREGWLQFGSFPSESEVSRACASLQDIGSSSIAAGPGDSWLAVTCLDSNRWSLVAQSERSSLAQIPNRKVQQVNLFGVFDNHQDCILVVDCSGIVRYANRASYLMLGQDSLVDEVFPLAVTGVGTNELNFRRADGQMVVAEMSTQSTVWNDQSVWLVTLRDVTELRLKDLQLRQAQKMEVVGQLAGGIAHDFNNLLMVIGGHADLLADQLPIRHPGIADIEELRKAVKMGSVLANKLLAFSRDKPMKVRRVEVNQALEDVSKTLNRLLRDDVSLSLELVDATLTMVMDSTDLTQILMNLVLNSQDAIEGSGRITLGSRLVPASTNTREPRVEIFVQDTGSGMATGVLERAFEPFFSTKELDEGTGLGLAVIDRLVKQYDGDIEVKSLEGQGTVFRVFFPLSDSPPEYPSGEDEQCPVNSNFRAIRVLLVDDHELVRNATRRFLERLGYEVEVSASGEEALSLVQECDEPFELLVTDVVMPGMNGFQLAKCLKEIDPRIRTLYMSGYTGPSLPSTRNALADQVMKKPFGLHELRSKLTQVLDGVGEE